MSVDEGILRCERCSFQLIIYRTWSQSIAGRPTREESRRTMHAIEYAALVAHACTYCDRPLP